MWKGLFDALPEGVLIISKDIIKYYNKTLKSTLIIGEENNKTKIEKEIFNTLKTIKMQENNISLYDIITNDISSVFLNDKEVIFHLSKANDSKFFQVNKFEINFQDELCVGYMIKDQTTTIQLEKQKMKDKYQRRYLASITHDLKTPVNGIMGIIRIVIEKIMDLEIIGMLETAMKSAELLLFLIRDILDLSQIEAKTMKLNTAQTDIRKVANESLSILINDFKQKQINITLNISAQVPVSIFTDENRYKQILINLLSNAFKHTQRGGKVRIKLEYNEETESLKTSVKDTGQGIKEEDIKKLFKRYGKVEDQLNLNPNSVGLGLNICKKLSKKLGGSIGVKSIYERGSTFYFNICNLISYKFNKSK